MRCSVKSGNERNPCRQLPAGDAGDSGGTARVKREEGADDVKSVWLLHPGLQTCYNGRYNGSPPREGQPILKTGPSSDRRLQLACVKSESLVKGHQQRSLEYVPWGLVHTARHIMEAGSPEAAGQPAMGAGVEGGSGNWDEVVFQGSRWGTSGWITSFLRSRPGVKPG